MTHSPSVIKSRFTLFYLTPRWPILHLNITTSVAVALWTPDQTSLPSCLCLSTSYRFLYIPTVLTLAILQIKITATAHGDVNSCVTATRPRAQHRHGVECSRPCISLESALQCSDSQARHHTVPEPNKISRKSTCLPITLLFQSVKYIFFLKKNK